MSTQIKRKPLSLEEKLEILNDLKKNNLTVTELTSDSGSSILKAENQEKIKNLYENNLINPSSKRMRGSNYVKIEEALDHWFKSVMAYKNITLNGPLIQAQAIKYATILNHTDFKASNGWLNAFKKRHNITFKTIVGDCIDKLRLYFSQKNEDYTLFIDQLSKMDQFCSVDQSSNQDK
ncbi:tigger transposable element-derived 4 [Brachionus plicatilis]|uniref:Tigger transposable element-derived 4 n=1 Tax=Brachionus plicatilis TaxID=10195 RepID=A0A3M7PY96_BRAPC|nr:tigger transposable element-derived 4 [Brachionus plicatilis]